MNSFHQYILSFWTKHQGRNSTMYYQQCISYDRINTIVQVRNTLGYLCTWKFCTPKRKYPFSYNYKVQIYHTLLVLCESGKQHIQTSQNCVYFSVLTFKLNTKQKKSKSNTSYKALPTIGFHLNYRTVFLIIIL